MTDALDSEKKSRMDEALAKLEEGVSFAEVARNYSEDKAKQGEFSCRLIYHF